MLPLTVRHGANGEYAAQLDPIHLGLIRWDQAIAAARQSGVPTSLDGRWHLSQNNGRFLAELIVSGGGGSILFYGLEREPIEGVSYSTSTGRVSFYRSRYPQTFVGTLTQDDEGHITVQGEWTAPDGNRGDWSAQYEGPAQ